MEVVQGVHALRAQDFSYWLEREFRMTNQDAMQVANFFMVPNNPNYVEHMKFQSTIQQEAVKYDQIVNQFRQELMEISTNLQKRHTGVYKWFINCARQAVAESALNVMEFQ